jgi:hypothetical protein
MKQRQVCGRNRDPLDNDFILGIESQTHICTGLSTLYFPENHQYLWAAVRVLCPNFPVVLLLI